MIPRFNESGVLPPGIHPATLDEIDAQFGANLKSAAYKWNRSAGWSIWPSALVCKG